MNAEEMKNRFEFLYEHMANSKDQDKMATFGKVAKRMFCKIMASNTTTGQEWIDMLESIMWNNYLSKSEAESIVANFVNQDGTRGPHWSYDTFKSAVESLGGKMADEPYYNCWALWVTANMRYSDNYQSASEFVPKDMMPKFFYKVALETLKDPDRPKFIRNYFDV